MKTVGLRGGEWDPWAWAPPGTRPGSPLTTRSSRVSNWSTSRRISTSPLWVSLEVGRLHGSFCCCSMISRPWRGRAAQAHPGSGVSGHQEPKCSLSSLPSQPFPFLHTFASAFPLTSKALPQPYLSIFQSFTLQHKPSSGKPS